MGSSGRGERRVALGIALLALCGLVSILLVWLMPLWSNAIVLVWAIFGVAVIAFVGIVAVAILLGWPERV